MTNSDEVNLYNNILSILTDKLMYSSQDEKFVRNKTK